MELVCEGRVEAVIDLTGGATQTIFPRAETLLMTNSDYWKALEYVAYRKSMERYRSVMDFLFCELHSRWRFACFRFYNSGSPPLRELITSEEVEEYEERILTALRAACELFRRQRRKDWTWFKGVVKRALAAGL